MPFDPSQPFESVGSKKGPVNVEHTLSFKSTRPQTLEKAAQFGANNINNADPQVKALAQAASGETPEISPVESALTGASTTGSVGLTKPVLATTALLTGNAKTWDEASKLASDFIQSAKKQNPKSYLGGGLLGSIGPAYGVGTIKALATSPILTGAGIGAAQGYSEAPYGKGLAGAVRGGILGGALGGVAKALSPQVAKETAEKAGLKATGFLQTQLKKVGGIEKAKKAVNTILEEGGVITPFKNATKMAAALDTVQETSGKVIGETLKQMDDLGIQTLNPSQIISDVIEVPVEGLNKTLGQVAEDVPEIAKELDVLVNRLSKVEQGGAATFKELQYQKQLLKKAINWKESDAAGNMANLAKKIMYGALNNSIDDSLAQATQKVGNPALSEAFQHAKNLYGAASTLMIGLSNQIKREAANKTLGLTDWIALAGGVGAGALKQPLVTAGSLGLVGAKKVAEKYGWQTLSSLANLSSKLSEVPIAGAIQKLATSAPAIVTFEPILAAAAEKYQEKSKQKEPNKKEFSTELPFQKASPTQGLINRIGAQ